MITDGPATEACPDDAVGMPRNADPIMAEDVPAATIESFQAELRRAAEAPEPAQRRPPVRKRARPPEASSSSSSSAPAAPAPAPPKLPSVDSVLYPAAAPSLREGWWGELLQGFAHTIAAGKVIYCPGETVFSEPLTESSTWVTRILPALDAFPADDSGGWNLVWKLSVANLVALGLPIRKPAVARVTKPGKHQTYSNLLKELAFSVHAARAGFGVRVYCAVFFLCDRQDESRPNADWRMLLLMEQADSDLVQLLHELRAQPSTMRMAARSLYDTCAALSSEGIFALDFKLSNALQTDRGAKVFVIDMDATYTFFAETMDTEATMLVNLLLLCVHTRNSFSEAVGSVGKFLEWLREPLLDLWARAKRGGFAGGAVLAQLKTPRKHDDSSFHNALKTLRARATPPSDVERLQALFPSIVYSYFIDVEHGDRQPPSACWDWDIHRPHDRPLLIPQLLKLTFFGTGPVPADLEALLRLRPQTKWPR